MIVWKQAHCFKAYLIKKGKGKAMLTETERAYIFIAIAQYNINFFFNTVRKSQSTIFFWGFYTFFTIEENSLRKLEIRVNYVSIFIQEFGIIMHADKIRERSKRQRAFDLDLTEVNLVYKPALCASAFWAMNFSLTHRRPTHAHAHTQEENNFQD